MDTNFVNIILSLFLVFGPSQVFKINHNTTTSADQYSIYQTINKYDNDSLNRIFQDIVLPYDLLLTESIKFQDQKFKYEIASKTLVDSSNQILKRIHYLESVYLTCNLNKDEILEMDIQNAKNQYARIIRQSVLLWQNDSITTDKRIKEYNEKLNKNLIQIQKFLDNHSGWLKFRLQGKEIKAFVVDLSKHAINFHLLNKEGKSLMGFENVINDLKEHGKNPLMVTNAGMFHSDYKPVGLFIKDGHVYSPVNNDEENMADNFHMYPNGVFYIDTSDNSFVKKTSDFNNEFNNNYALIKSATQSGPMMVFDNNIHSSFQENSKNLKIRSGVGVIKNGKIIFVITQKETFFQFAKIMKQLFGCTNALYLDGSISKIMNPKHDSSEPNDKYGPMISVSKK